MEGIFQRAKKEITPKHNMTLRWYAMYHSMILCVHWQWWKKYSDPLLKSTKSKNTPLQAKVLNLKSYLSKSTSIISKMYLKCQSKSTNSIEKVRDILLYTMTLLILLHFTMAAALSGPGVRGSGPSWGVKIIHLYCFRVLFCGWVKSKYFPPEMKCSKSIK